MILLLFQGKKEPSEKYDHFFKNAYKCDDCAVFRSKGKKRKIRGKI